MSAPAAPTAGGPPEPAVPENIRWVLLGVLLAMLLSQLDGLIVGTAMPTIVKEIGGLDRISWVVTAYTLTTACSTPGLGQARRPVRPQVHVPGVDRGLPYRLGPVRHGLDDERADRLPRCAGPRRRRTRRGGVRVDRRAAAAQGTRQVPGHGRHCHGDRQHRRSAGGRLHHRTPRLALGLLHQSAHRVDLHRVVPAAAARAVGPPRQGGDRLAGHHPDDRRHQCDRPGRDLGGQHLRLGLVADPGPRRGRCDRAHRLHRRTAARRRAAPTAEDLHWSPQLPAGRGAAHRRRRGHVRRHALPTAIPADRAGRLGHQLRPAPAADDGRHRLRLEHRRQADDQDPSSSLSWARPRSPSAWDCSPPWTRPPPGP